jgi:spore germination cell wall hydrolase CwlJ-like protein
LSLRKLSWSSGERAPVGEGGASLRRAQSGALAALLVIGLGGFVLIDPSAKDIAWASLPRPAGVKQPALLQITPGQAIERGVQPSALGAARPFQLTAVDAISRERAEKCLAEAIYFEAGSESEEGQRAVAQVVLNRMRHAAFPNSVCGVVYQGSERTTGCQFTFTCDGSLRRVPSQGGWQRAMAVARQALDGEVFASVGHATHYHATWMLPYWASSVAMVGRIGGHVFYSWKGATGSAAAFSQAYAGVEASKESFAEPVELAVAEPAPNLENPALGTAVKGADALEDPGNADLLNYRAAGNEPAAAARPDETEVRRAIESAL